MNKIDSFKGNNAWLSNFGGNIPWIKSEHLFQAMKTTDPEWQLKILACPTPGEAKRMGRQAPLRPDWEEIKIDVMWWVLQVKFNNNPELRQKLLDTGDTELIEGNWWGDAFWGVDNRTGLGQNQLGQLLMELRDQLKEEA